MRKYYLPIIIYTILACMCLGYAGLAFVDEDLSSIELRDPVDLPQLIMGLGVFFICAHIIFKYYKLER